MMMTILTVLALALLGYHLVWKNNHELNKRADLDDPLSWSPNSRLK
jgi:hypothetical protein